MDPSLLILAALFCVSMLAGFVDSIAGGGGLLTVPALLLANFDPVSALATNKLQSSLGSGSATLAFARRGYISVWPARWMIVATFAGACLGVSAIKIAPDRFVLAVLPFLLVALALYFALSPRLSAQAGRKESKPKLSHVAFALTAAPIVGFYDGVFGPGAGSFYMIAFVSLLGYDVIRATAHTKLLNFTSNLASLLVFASAGKVVWLTGLTMGAGQFIGAQIGSRLAVQQGARLIRPLLVVICCALAVKLLVDFYRYTRFT